MKWNKETIKRARTFLKVSQVDLAKVIGCRQQTISDWELGLYEPANTYTKVLNIVFVNVPVEYIKEPIYAH